LLYTKFARLIFALRLPAFTPTGEPWLAILNANTALTRRAATSLDNVELARLLVSA